MYGRPDGLKINQNLIQNYKKNQVSNSDQEIYMRCLADSKHRTSCQPATHHDVIDVRCLRLSSLTDLVYSIT